MQIRCPLVQETFSASDGFTRMIERHRILDVAGTRKSGVQCPQVRLLPLPGYETCRAVTLAAMVLRRQRPLLSASGDIFPHHPACRPKVCGIEGSDGDALATPGAGALGVAASMCGRRPIRGFQTKSPRRISPCGLLQFSR